MKWLNSMVVIFVIFIGVLGWFEFVVLIVFIVSMWIVVVIVVLVFGFMLVFMWFIWFMVVFFQVCFVLLIMCRIIGVRISCIVRFMCGLGMMMEFVWFIYDFWIIWVRQGKLMLCGFLKWMMIRFLFGVGIQCVMNGFEVLIIGMCWKLMLVWVNCGQIICIQVCIWCRIILVIVLVEQLWLVLLWWIFWIYFRLMIGIILIFRFVCLVMLMLLVLIVLCSFL